MTRLRLLGFLTALFFITLLPAPAFAILCGVGGGQCFVVAAGGNSAAATTWSATSGGTTCSGTTCATGPATTDFVCLDSLGGNLTLSGGGLTVVNFDESGTCTGGSGSAYTGTLNAGAPLTLTNGTKFYVSAGSTWTGAAQIMTFSPASATTLAVTTNGIGVNPITITGADNTAIVQLQGALSSYAYAGNSNIVVTTGKFDTNNQNVSGFNLISAGATTRAINCGTSTFTWNAALGGNSIINISATSGTPTWTCTGATFNFTNTSTTAGAALLFFGSNTGSSALGTMTFNHGGGGGYDIASGPVAVTNLNLNSATLYIAGLTTTVTTFTSSVSAGIYSLLSSTPTGGQGTLSVASGTVNCKCVVRNMIGSGGATFTANPGFDAGANTGWTFTGPASGGGGGIF